MPKPLSSQSVSPVPYWEIVERALAESRQEPAATPPPTVYVSDLIARQTARLLELAEREPSAPGVLYWLGFELGERACVTTLVRPDGAADRSLLTSAVAWDEALAAVADAALVYLGEATSRPEEAPPASAELPFGWLAETCAGKLSVVIPSLREGAFELAKCTVYRHLEGGYRRLAAKELDAHLRIVPGYTDLRKYRPPPASARRRAALVNVAEV